MAPRAMDSENNGEGQRMVHSESIPRSSNLSSTKTPPKCTPWSRRMTMSLHWCLLVILLCHTASCAHSKGDVTTGEEDRTTRAPLDIYLHKLGLILSPTKNEGGGGVFNGVVNATSADLRTQLRDQTGQKDKEGPGRSSSNDKSDLSHQNDDKSSSRAKARSLEFQCTGTDCPTAEFLRHSDKLDASDKRKAGKGQNILTPEITYKNKLGPLRVFKYIHNPEELRTLSTSTTTTTSTSTTTTTTPVPKLVNKHTTKSGKVVIAGTKKTSENHRQSSQQSPRLVQTPSSSAKQKLGEQPSTSTKQRAVQQPSSSTKPKVVQQPSSSTKPKVVQQPSSSTKPKVIQQPSSSTKQRSVQQPSSNTKQKPTKALPSPSESKLTPSEIRNKQSRNSMESQQNEISSENPEYLYSAEIIMDNSDRSLIPNSYFSSSSSSGSDSQEFKLNSNGTKIIVNGTLEADGFRPRRSPFRPHWRDHKLYTNAHAHAHSREALYQMAPTSTLHVHPPPPGFAAVPIPKTQGSPAMVQHALVPISTPPVRPSGTYQQFPSATDRNYVRSIRPDAADSPEEQGSIRMNSFKHPPNGKRGRRPPPRGKRPGNPGPVPSVMPPPKPIPVPVPIPVPMNGQRHHKQPPPHHHQHHRGPPPKNRPPPPPQPLRAPPNSVHYTYPKDAANIQDILTYFKTEENEIPGGPIGSSHKNPSGSSMVPALSGGGGISSEFRDVHASLLKDIQNFAKRPSQLAGKDSREGGPPPPPPPPSTLPLFGPEDPLDERIEPKHGKPVRLMTQYRENEKSKPKGSDYHKDRDGQYEPAGTRHRYEEDEDYEEVKHKRPKAHHSDRDRGHRDHHDRGHRYPEDEDDYDYRHYDSQRTKEKPRHRPKGHEDYDERPVHSDPRPRERERHRDYGLEHHYSSKSRTKSHRRRPKSHKSKSKSHTSHHTSHSDHHRDKYRTNKERDALGSRERESIHPVPPKIIHHYPPPAPTTVVHHHPPQQKIVPLSHMDQAYYQQRNRPVVIKRPYQPYRPVDINKLEQRRKHHDKYWNTVEVVKVVEPKPNPNVISNTFARPTSALPQPVETHYHYYGIGAPGISTSPRLPIPASTTRRPTRVSPSEISHGSMEADVLEIHHTGGVVQSTPIYSPPPNYNSNGGSITYTNRGYPQDSEKKAHMHKMYMDYLQRKLEAQAEAQAEAMLNHQIPSIPSVMPSMPPPQPPSTAKPSKRPMRMKIHIYPNEKIQVVDHSNPNPQTVYYANPNQNAETGGGGYVRTSSNVYSNVPATQNFYSNVASNGYSNVQTGSNGYSNVPMTVHRNYGHYEAPHTPTMVPPVVISQAPHPMTVHHHRSQNNSPPRVSLAPSSSSSSSSANSADKNKNLVLHLHVHRRNDNLDSGQMEMAGSETVTSTVKPLTYDDIYAGSSNSDMEVAENAPESQHSEDEPKEEDGGGGGHSRKNSQAEMIDSDKSLSVELPIRHDKIDDVLTTLLKLRE